MQRYYAIDLSAARTTQAPDAEAVTAGAAVAAVALAEVG